MFLSYFWNQVIAQPYWEQLISRPPAHRANKNQPKAKNPYANPQKKVSGSINQTKVGVLRHPHEWFFEVGLRLRDQDGSPVFLKSVLVSSQSLTIRFASLLTGRGCSIERQLRWDSAANVGGWGDERRPAWLFQEQHWTIQACWCEPRHEHTLCCREELAHDQQNFCRVLNSPDIGYWKLFRPSKKLLQFKLPWSAIGGEGLFFQNM